MKSVFHCAGAGIQNILFFYSEWRQPVWIHSFEASPLGEAVTEGD